jgi:superfamily II DNA/RNA helicase
MSFEKLGLDPNIVKALQEMDITEPTNIQKESIPLILSGRDLVGISKTGSGKTASFGLPIVEKAQNTGKIQTLVLTPTRELAVQIAKEMRKWTKYKKLHITTIYGGVSYDPQINSLRRTDIVVATPGRLLDLLTQGHLNLDSIKIVALDEADKMVEMGFIEDVGEILSYTPDKKQMLLFGATISKEIKGIEAKFMDNPETIKVSTQVHESYLQQFYYNVEQNRKFSLLMHLLENEGTERTIIFCSTRRTVDIVTHNLKKNGIKVEAIHGKLRQNRRLKVIEDFNTKHKSVLVASAVAARGLDIKNVSHVFNYDLPRDPEEYIHRVGRTARAGNSGKAFSLLCRNDHEAFAAITGRFPVKIEKLEVPEKMKRYHFEIVGQRRDSRSGGRPNRNGGRGFSRNSTHSRPREHSHARPRREHRQTESKGFGFVN